MFLCRKKRLSRSCRCMKIQEHGYESVVDCVSFRVNITQSLYDSFRINLSQYESDQIIFNLNKLHEIRVSLDFA